MGRGAEESALSVGRPSPDRILLQSLGELKSVGLGGASPAPLRVPARKSCGGDQDRAGKTHAATTMIHSRSTRSSLGTGPVPADSPRTTRYSDANHLCGFMVAFPSRFAPRPGPLDIHC